MQQLEALRAANIARQAEWCPDQVPDLSFRGNELAGETGEACNIIKKLERERHGWAGSRATLDQLAQELADVIICVDLVAQQTGIDLWTAVVAKFNATSEARGLRTMLDAGRSDVVVPDDIARILADALGVDRNKVTADARLYEDLGADSLDAMEIVTTIEMERDISISDSEAEAIVTVADLVSIIQLKS